ncbi:MAG TPA: hypothetical protein VJH34_00915 [archaeon]|nr:hypothetical protein [archaeon]
MKIDYSKYLDKVKFWKETIENVKDFTGTSPPSVFVGKANYPRIFVGILSPPNHNPDAEILDSPERWYQQKASIDQIFGYRGQMIYSRLKASSIKPTSNKLIDVVQEVSMSKDKADVEIKLKKTPEFKFSFSNYFAPVGNPAPIETARLTENPKVDIKVEHAVSDTDLKAANAIVDLYSHIPVSNIQKIFSVGLLGVPLQRKFVPTRWSITGVDDIIGKHLMENVRHYNNLDEIRLFRNDYIGNTFHILLIPREYQFELVEIWDTDKPFPGIGSDYEPYWGRKTYAERTAGGFYASRLPVLEYLDKIEKQASILIVREVKPEYFAPVGVWKIRETVRDAFNKPFERFDDLEQAFTRITNKCVTKNMWKRESKLFKILREQKGLAKFL